MLDLGPNIARAHERFASTGLVEALSEDDGQVQRWLDYELASFVENRAGVLIEPTTLDEGARRAWTARSTLDAILERPHSPYARPFWIRDADQRVGTVVLGTTLHGSSMLNLSSLYLHPGARHRGLSRRVLGAAYDALLAEGLHGLRLDTSWSWQPAVRHYLSLGMWVYGWKRDLVLAWQRKLPAWSLEVDGDDARFVVDGAALIVARRRGERLEWRELGGQSETALLAPGTFALALARLGWPLITSDAEWAAQLARGWSDMGGPEGLAFKIPRWEAWDRHHGWRVDTPRIPGLAYPSWDELNRD
ncbi:MAG: GNAT family N-acetyltransferase [Myxococcales bacterium]|nr:GNAT family N-acetyltransferase [Myxococcales bacterium]